MVKTIQALGQLHQKNIQNPISEYKCMIIFTDGNFSWFVGACDTFHDLGADPSPS